MRIIIFPASYYPILGGLQEVAYRLAKEFKHRGHEVTIVTQRYPRSLKRKQFFKNIPIYRILFPNLVLTTFKLSNLLKYIAGLLIAPISLFQLWFLLKHEKPDLIYLHFLGISSFYLLASRILNPFKLVVTLHGDDVEGLPFQSRFHMWLFRKICIKADYVTACSEYILKKASGICPTINSKSRAIHNGIASDIFLKNESFNNCRHYIFAAGRFVYKKGFDILIKAFNLLIKKNYKIDLILAGEGPEMENYKKLANRIGLKWIQSKRHSNESSPKLIFWGRANRDEMMSLLAGSEMLVVPSRKEPFGLVVLEAMAAGTPVIASNIGGIPEIILNDKGILVTSENVFALCAAIETLLNNSKLRNNLIKNGKNRAKEFHWSIVAEKYLSIL